MSVVLASSDAVVEDEAANVLARIWEPDVHLAIWRRPIANDLEGLSDLIWDHIDDINELVSIETLLSDLPALLEAAGYAQFVKPLTQEIVAIGERLSEIMECAKLRLRLEVVETDACRKFHADNVAVRLLMTLSGPGTQWVRAEADRSIEVLGMSEVGLFKGRIWAEEPRILHRSPPIAATGETRLLLVIDPCMAGTGNEPGAAIHLRSK